MNLPCTHTTARSTTREHADTGLGSGPDPEHPTSPDKDLDWHGEYYQCGVWRADQTAVYTLLLCRCVASFVSLNTDPGYVLSSADR